MKLKNFNQFVSESILRFSDGVNIDTSGPVRMLELEDGLYVVGNGQLIPVNSEEEANRIIDNLTDNES
jgi:hypothetical protein